MPIEAFPIADPKVGLALFRDPWRTPQEAMYTSNNVEVYRGRIKKRPGSTLFARLFEFYDLAVNLTVGDGGATYTDLLLVDPIVWPADQGITMYEEDGQTQTFTWTDAEVLAAMAGTGLLTKSNLGYSITIDVHQSAIRTMTFPVGVVLAKWIRVDYDYLPNVETAVVAEDHGTFNGSGFTVTKRLAPYPHGFVKPLSVTINAGAATMTNTGWDPEVWAGPGTVDFDWARGEFTVTWTIPPPPFTPITVDYTYWKRDSVQGMSRLKDAAGNETLFAFSKFRAYRYIAGRVFRDLTDRLTADDFAGVDDGLYWTAQAVDGTTGEGVLVAINGDDPPMKVNPLAALPADRVTIMGGGVLGHPLVDFDGVALAAEVQTARHALQYRESIVYFDIDEGATRFARRARWTQPGQWERLEQFDFADAPTDDTFVGATTWRDEIWVFFQNSIMRLRHTGDPAPGRLFEWLTVDDEAGLISKFTVVSGQEQLYHLSKIGPHSFDGRTSRRTDEVLGDYISQIDPGRAHVSVGKRVRSRRQVWLAHPKIGSQFADQMLVQSLEGGHFTTWDLPEPITCMIDFETQVGVLVDDITDILVDDYDVIVDDPLLLAGFPTVLAGRLTGEVIQIPSTSGLDLDVGFVAQAGFEGLNPYLAQKQPVLARLHYLQLYMDAGGEGDAVVVLFYRDSDQAPYLIRIVDISPEDNNDKVWRTILVNETATQHKILVIWGSTLVQHGIDAIVPYFSPEGPIWSRAGLD